MRLRFNFWLAVGKDFEVIRCIRLLKKTRGFSSAIREGILIIFELREGRTEILIKLFPWLPDALCPSQAAPQNTDEILRELAGLQALLLRQPPPVDRPPLVADAPLFVAVEKSSAGESRANFAGGMGDLFGDDETWN